MTKEISILLVEDDPQSALRVESLIYKLGYHLTATCDNAPDALDMIQSKSPDILILDIDLKGEMSGLDLAEALTPRTTPVIFVTGHTEEDIYDRARSTRPAAYLTKPFNSFTLQTAIENSLIALTQDRSSEQEEWSEDLFIKNSFFVKRNNFLQKVNLDDIVFIHSDGNYCEIFSNKKFAVKLSLTKILQKLPPRQFIRVHQRYIVQASMIEMIDTQSNELHIAGKDIPIGPKYREELLRKLDKL